MCVYVCCMDMFTVCRQLCAFIMKCIFACLNAFNVNSLKISQWAERDKIKTEKSSCTKTEYPPLVSAAHTLTQTKQNAVLTSMKVKHQVGVQRGVECSNTQTFIFIQRAGLIKWIKPWLAQIKGLPHSSEDFDWLSIWKPVIFTHLLVKALFYFVFFFSTSSG